MKEKQKYHIHINSPESDGLSQTIPVRHVHPSGTVALSEVSQIPEQPEDFPKQFLDVNLL